MQALASESTTETDTPTPTVKGSVDNPVTVTPSEFTKLIPLLKFGDELDQQSTFGLAQLNIGSKEIVNQGLTQALKPDTSTASEFLTWLNSGVMIIRIDETHYFGIDSQTSQKLYKLDETSFQAYQQEVAEAQEKYLKKLGITPFDEDVQNSSPAVLKLYSENWDVVRRAAQDTNKISQKYVDSDIIITSDNLATTVARQGGYGLLRAISSGPSGSFIDGSVVYTVIKVTEEPKSDSSGGGFGGIVIVGVVLTAIVGILMHLGLIPRFL